MILKNPIFNKFLHNDLLYAYVEGPSVLLDTVIPIGATNSIKKGGDQKILREFVAWHWDSLDGTKCIILLNAPKIQCDPFPLKEEAFAEWNSMLPGYGFTINNWMNQDEFIELLESPDYTE